MSTACNLFYVPGLIMLNNSGWSGFSLTNRLLNADYSD